MYIIYILYYRVVAGKLVMQGTECRVVLLGGIISLSILVHRKGHFLNGSFFHNFLGRYPLCFFLNDIVFYALVEVNQYQN